MFKFLKAFILFQAIGISWQCLTVTNPYDQCGQVVSRGGAAGRYAQPWIVSITCDYKVSDSVVDKIGHICGGTIVSSRHVLTAAHCLQIPSNYIDKKYYLNTYNPNLESVFKVAIEGSAAGQDDYVYYKIKRVFIHEGFDNTTLVNDIALLELEDELTFNKNTQSICLPDQEIQGYPHTGKDSYLVAWHSNRDKSISDIKQIDMSVVNDDYCSKYANQDIQICAKALRSTGACRGDSGGPLIIQDRNCEDGAQCSVLAGITSYILGKRSNPYDCNSLYPTFFTRVSAYTPWIKTNMFNAYY